MKNKNSSVGLNRRHALQMGGLVLLLGTRDIARGATIVAVRVWPSKDYTRLTIESDTEIKARQFFIPEPPDLREQFIEKRQVTIDRLRGLGLEPEWPAAGYFVWLNVASLGLTGRSFAEKLLKEQQVLVGPGCAFGPSGTHHVRISFAAEAGRLREGLSRLGTFVRELRGESRVPEHREAEIVEVVDHAPAFSRA